MKRSLLWILVVLCGRSPALAQETALGSARQHELALRVFLDCDRGCDFDYLRREVDFVNYVRDRRDAQVHVLVTLRRTGSRGREFTLDFIGVEEFEGDDHVLLFASSGTDTDDERRQGFAKIFALGLMRYVAQTPLAELIELEFTPPADGEQPMAGPGDDRWNFWVFRLGTNARLSGESRQDFTSVEGSVTANRVTDAWKIAIGLDGEFEEDNFEFDDGETFNNRTREIGLGGQVVKSLGERWGLGAGFALAASTFSNLDPSTRYSGAIQYDIFPFSESSQRLMTFTYFAGVNFLNYEEETIFEKTEETLADQGVMASLDLNQPWGQAGFDVEASHFLNDASKYRVTFRGNIEWRIVRGLSLDIFGDLALVRDQIFLPKGGTTDEEILLQRRALETDFRYFLGLGVSYTFGSIFNNIVNPRFTGSSGGFSRIVRDRRRFD